MTYFDFEAVSTGHDSAEFVFGADAATDAAIEMKFMESETIFSGHFPNFPVVPASLIIDLCANLVAKFHDIPSLVGSGWRLARSKFEKGIHPGDRIRFDIQNDERSTTIILTCNKIRIATLNFDREETEIPSFAHPDPLPAMTPAKKYLPQRYPLLVVDLVGRCVNSNLGVARKFVSYSDYCFRSLGDADAENYSIGGVIEGIEQAAANLLLEHCKCNLLSDDHVILVAGLNGVRFDGNAVVGDIIDYTVRLNILTDDFAILSGQARVGNRAIMSIDKVYVTRQAVM